VPLPGPILRSHLSFLLMKEDDAQARSSKIEAIQRSVAEMFGISVEELTEESRKQVATMPRQIAMYLVKQLTDASLPEIGRHFGGKHHTTVMHAIAKIDEQKRRDSALDHAITKLLKGQQPSNESERGEAP
jgi:chromosomal replication initiator protein